MEVRWRHVAAPSSGSIPTIKASNPAPQRGLHCPHSTTLLFRCWVSPTPSGPTAHSRAHAAYTPVALSSIVSAGLCETQAAPSGFIEDGGADTPFCPGSESKSRRYDGPYGPC